MITYLKSDDFKEKQYYDEFDESSLFVRGEECKHYTIKMKRKSKDFKFTRFEIEIFCKKCENETKQIFSKGKGELIFKCPKCRCCCEMIFRYNDTNQNENGEEKYKIPTEEKYEKIDESKKSDSLLINPGLKNYQNDILFGGNQPPIAQPKIYHTPDQNINCYKEGNLGEAPLNNNNNKTPNINGYNNIKINDINNNGKYNIICNNQNYYNNLNNILNNNINISNGKEINIKFIYNGSKFPMKFSDLDSIGNNYDRIKNQVNFPDGKKFYYNSNVIDINKSFKENNIYNNCDIEIDN